MRESSSALSQWKSLRPILGREGPYREGVSVNFLFLVGIQGLALLRPPPGCDVFLSSTNHELGGHPTIQGALPIKSGQKFLICFRVLSKISGLYNKVINCLKPFINFSDQRQTEPWGILGSCLGFCTGGSHAQRPVHSAASCPNSCLMTPPFWSHYIALVTWLRSLPSKLLPT